MLKRLTQSRKIMIACIVVILSLFALTLFLNFSREVAVWIYIGGIISIVVVFEVYLFFSYVSNRFNTCFVHTSLQIVGAYSGDRVYVDVNGKLHYKFPGNYNGIIKLRGGRHEVTFYNKLFSVQENVEIKDNMAIYLDVKNSTVTVSKECRQRESAEEIEKRLKSYNRVNLYLFLAANILMVLAIFRILAIYDIVVLF